MQSRSTDDVVTYKLVIVGEGKFQRKNSFLSIVVFRKGGVGKSALTIQVSTLNKLVQN